MTTPTHITAIREFSGIGPFAEHPISDVEILPSDPSRGQTIVVTGAQGSGKTSVLRGLMLALGEPVEVSRALGDWPPMSTRRRTRFEVELPGGVLASRLSFEGRTSWVQSERVLKRRPWVRGYGPSRDYVRGQYLPSLSASLFDRTADMVDPRSWLDAADHRVLIAQRTGHDEHRRTTVWKAACLALYVMLGLTELECHERGVVMAKHPEHGTIPLDSLGHGDLAIAALVVDILADWIDRYYATVPRDIDGPNALLESITGVVLIDEVGLHLGPERQRTVLDDLRVAFPRLTFVVSTSSPEVADRDSDATVLRLERQDDRTVMLARSTR